VATIEMTPVPAAAPDERSLLPLLDEGKPSARGWLARRIVQAGVIGAGLALIAVNPPVLQTDRVTKGLIFVIIGFSLHILLGYAGQISLGHQAFVGVGAFTSALLVSKGLTFWVAIFVSGATGALTALILGFVALRLKGLVLALVTFAYGQVAVNSIFAIPQLTGGGAGVDALRPAGFEGDKAWAYLVAGFLALIWLLDWRLVKSKAGRAIMTIRENEVAAASFGINVVGYKILAFVLSGAIAGIGGALFAHHTRQVAPNDFNFQLALVFVLMVVVGGLGSRPGVFVGSMFFGIFPLAVPSDFVHYGELIGALLLLLTLTMFPGGIGQQLKPFTDWIAGHPFHFSLKPQRESGISSGGAGVRP